MKLSILFKNQRRLNPSSIQFLVPVLGPCIELVTFDLPTSLLSSMTVFVSTLPLTLYSGGLCLE